MKTFYTSKIFIISIILTQVILILYFADHKPDMFIDEWWSFSLACGDIPFIGDAKECFNILLPQSFWETAVSVEPNKIFDLSQVWDSQARDVHPPFYYAILHIFRGIFQGSFDFKLGIYLNLIFFLITQYFIYKTTYLITKSKTASITTIIFYGFSLGGISSVMYIRMYMMLTCCVIVSLHLHLKLITTDNRQKLFTLILISIIHIVGFLTNYYYCIFIFFTAILSILWILIKQEKIISYYTISTLISIFACYIIFPAFTTHIIGGGGTRTRSI